MTAIGKKLLVAGVVLSSCVAYLSYAGAKGGGWVYYVDVDKVATEAQYRTQRVRMHGKVAAEGFVASPGQMLATFTLVGKTQSIPVTYKGVIPDMFKAEGEVVVEGKYDETGRFQADVLMTKCASKYEERSPHATDAGGAT